SVQRERIQTEYRQQRTQQAVCTARWLSAEKPKLQDQLHNILLDNINAKPPFENKDLEIASKTDGWKNYRISAAEYEKSLPSNEDWLAARRAAKQNKKQQLEADIQMRVERWETAIKNRTFRTKADYEEQQQRKEANRRYREEQKKRIAIHARNEKKPNASSSRTEKEQNSKYVKNEMKLSDECVPNEKKLTDKTLARNAHPVQVASML
ncbi:unnamed protein product, partial [Allacma fusca]